MTLALLIAGIFAVVAGLLAILFGIPVKEFSFGNTLILVGAIGVCSGMLLIGLSAVVQELKKIARRLGSVGGASEVRVRPVLPPGLVAPTGVATDAGATESMKAEPPSAPSLPPWQDEAAARERQRIDAPATEAAAAPEPPRRRNLLFQSTSRRERERAQAPEGSPLEQPAPDAPEPAEAPPASFEDAWPKPDRMRPQEMPAPRRPPLRTSPAFAEPSTPTPAPATEPEPPATPRAEQAAVTVLKSGVVDGMAYSLYSDGSIEAQMPEGMMRFASIDELRAHLDQRS